MLACIDIGNTVITLGLFDGEEEGPTWRIRSIPGKTADEYGLELRGLFAGRGIAAGHIDGIIIGSVVPPLTPVFQEVAREEFGRTALVVDAGIRTGLKIRFENPREIGADRIANTVAVKSFCRLPACIVDFGTATAFDAVSATGEYLGGAIAPGLTIASEALFEHTAKLPRVELSRPTSVIGRNTAESLRSGLLFGYVALVEGMIDRFRRELGPDLVTVATGTWAERIAGETDRIDRVDPRLALTGLRIIYGMNAGESS